MNKDVIKRAVKQNRSRFGNHNRNNNNDNINGGRITRYSIVIPVGSVFKTAGHCSPDDRGVLHDINMT